MVLAGVWSTDHEAIGTRVATCAVITCAPNPVVARIHNRMPVILPPGARSRWLDHDIAPDELQGMLAPLPADEIEAYEVSTLVSAVSNDSPECINPV